MAPTMKVIILCGGRGTRMQSETVYLPKPLVEIGGKPILWHIMKTYDYYGFKDFILCLGYKGEMIKNYFYNYEMLNKDFTIELGSRKITPHESNMIPDWKVTLVDTGRDAQKGARLFKVKKYVESSTFMLTYGDGLANIDINKLLAFHKNHGRIATLTGVRPPSRFGKLDIEGDKVTKFVEKPQTTEGIINGGFMVFEKEIFNYLNDDDSCDLEIGALEELAKEDELRMYLHSDSWVCMDSVRDMIYLNRLWDSDQAFWKID